MLCRALVLLSLLLAGAPPASAAERLAFFGFELINTSLEPTRPDETARLATIGEIARTELAKHGYDLVDTAAIADEVAKRPPLRHRHACEVDFGERVCPRLRGLGRRQEGD